MNQKLKDIIELETFLFHGVPENKRKKTAMPTKTDHSELKHTPGPWTHRGDGLIVCNTGNVAQTCKLDRYVNGSEEANARLIAAAPEMLEALKGAVSMLEHSYQGENPEDNPIMDSIQAWRSVIDKV